jgi:hypothetical protein
VKESDWLDSPASPMALFERIRVGATPRQLQLLAIHVTRLLDVHVENVEIIPALLIAENYADRLEYSEEKFLSARNTIWEVETAAVRAIDANGGDWLPNTLGYAHLAAVASAVNPNVSAGATRAIWFVIEGTTRAAEKGKKQAALTQIRREICDVIREIFGNPFRTYNRTPSWAGNILLQPDGQNIPLTDTVLGLAEAIYRTGDFSRMPILADALEEAGISDDALLDHCREAKKHTRGCWVLDLVRG